MAKEQIKKIDDKTVVVIKSVETREKYDIQHLKELKRAYEQKLEKINKILNAIGEKHNR